MVSAQLAKNAPTLLCVTVTCKDKAEAEHISERLLEKKLVACVNMFQVSSSYWWEGKLGSAQEYILSCKTSSDKLTVVQREIKKLHSYNLPVISWHEEQTTKDVEKWIKGALK